MSNLKPFYRVTRAETLADVHAWLPPEDEWIFRGQSNSQWDLSTSLERALAASPEGLIHALDLERGLVRRFQREANHYLSHLPDDGNIPEWLAIMQHYGAPTRLLDWTHSFDVALFFAVIDQRSPPASVWAINWKWIDAQLPADVKAIYKEDRNCSLRKSFAGLSAAGTGVAKLNSYRISQRQAVQQATFLVPLDVTKPFEANLHASLKGHGRKHMKRLDLPLSLRAEIVMSQYRGNIHHSSLFPGIDGFARSLNSMLLVPHLLHPGDPWKKDS